jgi:opacity protein-like surface antigen
MRTSSWLPGLALAFLFAAAAWSTARAQTSVALNVYGAFGSTAGSNLAIQDTPSNAAGGMLELRHIRNPLVGYEATYSYNRANQRYVGFCSLCSAASVSANAHQIAGDWLISAHAGNLRPFALAGAGLLLTEPTSGQSQTQSSNAAVYIYGAGLDWRLLPHLGLRFQYRGNVHKVPFITTVYGPSINAFTHTAEPMLGAYFKF